MIRASIEVRYGSGPVRGGGAGRNLKRVSSRYEFGARRLSPDWVPDRP